MPTQRKISSASVPNNEVLENLLLQTLEFENKFLIESQEDTKHFSVFGLSDGCLRRIELIGLNLPHTLQTIANRIF